MKLCEGTGGIDRINKRYNQLQLITNSILIECNGEQKNIISALSNVNSNGIIVTVINYSGNIQQL